MLKKLLFAYCFFILCMTFPAQAAPKTCENDWMPPSSQTMSIDSEVSFTLIDYKNGERHFLARQGQDSAIEIYFLRGALLVKGYSKPQLEQVPVNALFMTPMTFFVPITTLSSVSQKGPCGIEGKVPIAIHLDGSIGTSLLKRP